MRLSSSRVTALTHRPQQDFPLWDKAGTRPSLDLQFADRRDLVDATTGSNLVDFTRASSGTYVGSDGLVKTATTDEARFDHDPTTGESLGLLVEESRTNLLQRTEEFDNNYWVKASSSTVTPYAGASPDGLTTAETFTTTGAGQSIYNATGVTATAGTAYTFSVYVKLGTMSAADYKIAVYDVSNSAFIAVDIAPTIALTASSWSRVTYTFTTPSGCTSVRVYPFRNGSAITSSTVHLWGAQFEAGSFPTSYIKNVDAVLGAIRAADVASISGSNFGVFRTNLLQYSEEFDQAAWIPAGSSITPNALTAPSGNLTADALVDTTLTEVHSISQTLVGASGNTTYTISCRLKKGSQNYGCLVFGPNAAWGAGGGAAAFFDLVNGTASTVASATATIEPLADGWYLCTASATTTASPGNPFFRLGASATGSAQTYLGTGEKAVYLWGAQVEEGSAATPYIKSDVNWTNRNSNATYYDVNGTLKKSSYNLLLRSEEFNNTSLWSPIGVGTSITQDATTAPDGTNTADRIQAASGASGVQQVLNLALTPHTYSIYVKKAGVDADAIVRLSIGPFYLTFNLVTGTFSDVDPSYDTPVATQAGNGWWRISGSRTATATANAIRVFSTPNDNLDVYIWGAQLETGTYAGDYAKTTTTAVSTPRTAAYLPDGNGNFISAGPLLLEAAGTNSLTDSEDLSGYSTADVTVPFDSSAINPTGSTGSYKILADFGFSSNGVRIRDFKSSSNNIVVSAFVKKSTHRYVYIGFGGTANSFTALFDIEPGLTSNRLLGQGGNGERTNIDAGYQNLPNDWIRIWAVGTTTGTDGPTVGLGPNATTFNITNWTAAGTEEIYAWGLQYEDNVSFPTSYIPTQGSPATRAADVSTSAATTVFESDWYRQEEGTSFIEAFTAFTGVSGANFYRFGLYGNGIRLARSGSGATPQLLVTVVNSATQGSPYAGFLQPNVFAKIIAAYKVDDFAISTNGSSLSGNAVDTSGSVPQGLTSAVLMDGNFGCVRRFTYWPQRLPNDTLQIITQ